MKRQSRVLGLLSGLALCAGLVATADPALLRAQEAKEAEVFTATSANLSNIGTGRTSRVDVRITRWTTDAEQEELRTALVENGVDGLYKALQNAKSVGTIRVNDSLGWDLRYARNITSGSGRRIMFATDRPIGAWEARNRPRTMDYKFTIGELKVDAAGKGEGSLSPAVKVTYDKTDAVLELETFASEPLRLLQVRKVQ
jgi:hypothetical protein